MRRILNAIIILILLSTPAFAANLFIVDEKGGGLASGICNSDKPCTLTYALSIAQSGDTIKFNSGTYETAALSIPTGVSITAVQPDVNNLDNVIIRPLSNMTGPLINLASASPGTNGNQSISYITFDGDDGSHAARQAIYLQNRSNISIHHCVIKDFKGAASAYALYTVTTNSGHYPPTSLDTYYSTLFNPPDFSQDASAWPTYMIENFQFYNNYVSTSGYGKGLRSEQSPALQTFHLKNSSIYGNTIDVSTIYAEAIKGTTAVWDTVNVYNNILIGHPDAKFLSGSSLSMYLIEVWGLENCKFYGNKLISGGISAAVTNDCEYYENYIYFVRTTDTTTAARGRGIEATKSQNVNIHHNNIQLNNKHFGAGIAIGADVHGNYGGSVTLNNYVHNNIIHGAYSDAKGLQAYGIQPLCEEDNNTWVVNAYIINNAIDGSSSGGYAGVFASEATTGDNTLNITLMNNIITNHSGIGVKNHVGTPQWTTTNNIWSGNAVNSSPSSIATNDIVAGWQTTAPTYSTGYEVDSAGSQYENRATVTNIGDKTFYLGLGPDTDWGTDIILPSVVLTKHGSQGNGEVGPYVYTTSEPLALVATSSTSSSASDYFVPVSYTVPDVLQTFTVAATAGDDGSISPSGTVSVLEGKSEAFTISPNNGFHIADVRVDDRSVGAISSYEFSDVSGPHTISVSFAPNMFTITAKPGSNGAITPGTVSVSKGSGKTFTIAANSGFKIADVAVDSQSVGAVTSYTFNDIAANHTIAAVFNAVSSAVSIDYVFPDSTNLGDSSSGSSDGSGSTDSTSSTSESFGTVIIDNRDQGATATGTWSVSSAPGFYGINSVYSSTPTDTYSFEMTCSGSREVYLWWTEYSNRCTNVPVEIYDGSTYLDTVTVNQQNNGGQWNNLGTFSFTGKSKVIIASNGGCITSADAVQFVPSGSTSPDDPIVSSDTYASFIATDVNGPSDSSNISASDGATTANNRTVVVPTVTRTQEFINLSPDQPELLLPGNGERDVPLTPLLEITGFRDPDADDDHGATRWQIALDNYFELLILDVTIDRNRNNNYLVNFLVPHGALCSDQLYYWRVSVQDAREGDPKWSNWSEPFTFTTAAKVEADVNANAVADDEEPEYSDLDSDSLNDNDQPLMKVLKSRKDQSLIGIKAVNGVSQINCFTSVDPESIPDEPGPKLRYGLMVFNVALDQIGGTAKFELYLPEKPYTWAKWYKYDTINGWYEFPVDIVGDKYFIEITDGGFGDADGVQNGIVVDPIGLAEMSTELETIDSFDALDSGDSESTLDRLKNACFIQASLDRSVVETTDVGARQMMAFRFVCCVLLVLISAIAMTHSQWSLDGATEPIKDFRNSWNKACRNTGLGYWYKKDKDGKPSILRGQPSTISGVQRLET